MQMPEHGRTVSVFWLSLSCCFALEADYIKYYLQCPPPTLTCRHCHHYNRSAACVLCIGIGIVSGSLLASG